MAHSRLWRASVRLLSTVGRGPPSSLGPGLAAAWARSISRRLAPPQAQHQPAIQREKGTTWCEKVGVQSTPGGVRLSSLSILVQNFPHTSGAEKCFSEGGATRQLPEEGANSNSLRGEARPPCTSGRGGRCAARGSAARRTPAGRAGPRAALPRKGERRRITRFRKLFCVGVGMPGLRRWPPQDATGSLYDQPRANIEAQTGVPLRRHLGERPPEPQSGIATSLPGLEALKWLLAITASDAMCVRCDVPPPTTDSDLGPGLHSAEGRLQHGRCVRWPGRRLGHGRAHYPPRLRHRPPGQAPSGEARHPPGQGSSDGPATPLVEHPRARPATPLNRHPL